MSKAGCKSKGLGRKPKPSSAADVTRKVSHRWRDYQTASGRRPIKDFLDGLDDSDLASVIAGDPARQAATARLGEAR